MAYDAFISYSHAADGRLAPVLKAGLERMGRSWSQSRALRVFRDVTDLGVNADLWSSITSVLDESRWFVLLASPAAAASPRVNREIEHWRAHKDRANIMIVLTDGDLEWDSDRGDFDPDVSSALPPALVGEFSKEPLYLDLRWARDAEHLDLRHSRFRDAVAGLAAPMHGVDKDDLESEDVRQHRKTLRYKRCAISAFVFLVISLAISISVTITVVRTQRADQRTAAAQTLLQNTQTRLASTNAKLARTTIELARDRTLKPLTSTNTSVAFEFADGQSRQLSSLRAQVAKLQLLLAACKAGRCP